MTADLRRAAKKLLKLVRQQNAYLAIRPGAKLFGGNFSRKAMTADLHRLVKNACPPKPLVTPFGMWGPMGDIITRAQFQLNRFRG